MNVISYSSARVTWLFQLEEVLPLKRSSINLYELIAERYSFSQSPSPSTTTPEQMARDGLTFALGKFLFENNVVPITEFKVFNDGMVATASTSDVSDAFLIDLTQWLQSQHGFRDFSSPVRELCLSEVTVEFERPLSRLIAAYEAISTALSMNIGPLFGTSEAVQLARMDFGLDPSSPNVKVAGPRFVLERRSGVSFDQERYFSSAPLSTENHISLLRLIEQHLSQS